MQSATSFALSRFFYIDVQHQSGGSDCTSFQCQSGGSIYMLLMKEPHHLNNPAYSNPLWKQSASIKVSIKSMTSLCTCKAASINAK